MTCVGGSGLEQGLEEELTASSGGDLLVVDEAGDTIEVVGGREPGKPKNVR